MLTRKLYLKLKSLYKNFVIVISQDRSPSKEDFISLEKQLNDTLETVLLFIS